MHALPIILIWVANFGISAWNAYAVGMAWAETRHAGGWPRVVAWSGAVMSACGFSWCYLIVFAFAAHGMQWISDDDLLLALQLGYLLLIPGVLASGATITLDSWARAYRTRGVADIGVAAWNSFAQVRNSYHAIRDVDRAFGSVVDGLRSKRSGNNKGAGAVVIFLIVLLALLSGVLTTAVIIHRFAGSAPLPDRPDDAGEAKGRESDSGRGVP